MGVNGEGETNEGGKTGGNGEERSLGSWLREEGRKKGGREGRKEHGEERNMGLE